MVNVWKRLQHVSSSWGVERVQGTRGGQCCSFLRQRKEEFPIVTSLHGAELRRYEVEEEILVLRTQGYETEDSFAGQHLPWHGFGAAPKDMCNVMRAPECTAEHV